MEFRKGIYRIKVQAPNCATLFYIIIICVISLLLNNNIAIIFWKEYLQYSIASSVQIPRMIYWNFIDSIGSTVMSTILRPL